MPITHIKKTFQILAAVLFLSGLCHAENIQWTVTLEPKVRIIRGLWGFSPDSVFAVGDHGTILSYDGTQWQMMESGTDTHLKAIWGTDKNTLFAVGDQGTVLHYTGGRWQKAESPVRESLSCIRGQSADNIFAAGEKGTILHFDGSRWKRLESGTKTTFFSLWSIPGSDVFAVGGGGTILRYSSNAWNPMNSPDNRKLYSVWGRSNSDIYASGSGAVLYFDGRNWEIQEDNFYLLSTFWGLSSSEIFAAGYSIAGESIVLRYENERWEDTGMNSKIPVYDLWGNTAAGLFAGGGNSESRGIIRHFDGEKWQDMWQQAEDGFSKKVQAVRYFSDSHAFAVGESGQILHYDGSRWTQMNSGTQARLTALWGSSAENVFAAGEDGTVLHYDGSEWEDMNSGNKEGLRDIWGYISEGKTVLFAAGDKGTVLRYEGEWEKMDTGSNRRLESLWGYVPNVSDAERSARFSGIHLFAAGWEGLILFYDGRQWRQMESGVEKNLYNVWGYPAENSLGYRVMAVGDRLGENRTNILEYEGLKWKAPETDFRPAVSLRSIWGSGESEIFIGGMNGFIRHYDGKQWQLSQTDRDANIYDLHGITDESGHLSRILAVDFQGTVLHCKSMSLLLPDSLTEGGAPGEGRVFIPEIRTSDLTVSLHTDDGSGITVPESLVIPAGKTSAVFEISAADDSIADGTESVLIRASAAAYNPGSALMQVHDNESAFLTLTLPEVFSEGSGLMEQSGSISVSPLPEKDIRVSLSSDHPADIRVPAAVTVPAGQSGTFFDIYITDNSETDDTRTAGISASVRGWPRSRVSVQIADNDRYALAVCIPESAEEAAGALTGKISVSEALPEDLSVRLTWDDASEISAPETLLLPAGSREIPFELLPLRDFLADGSQIVNLTAAAPGFAGADAEILITDSDFSGETMKMGTNIIRALWGSSAGDIFAAGWYGMIQHYDGSQWQSMDSGTDTALRHIWGYDRHTVYAVGGDSSSGIILRYDGSRWQTEYQATDEIFYWVWGSSPDNIYAVGDSDAEGGIILHYNGTQWRKTGPEGYADFSSIWGSSAADIFVAGKNGIILHYDGTDWSEMDSGSKENLSCIWGNAPDDVFAVAPGTILHYDGSIWTEMKGGEGRNFYSVWGTSGDNVYAVGNKGMILHYDGRQWSEAESGTDLGLWGIWGNGENEIYAAGVDAQVLHYDGRQWKTLKEKDLRYNGIWSFHDERGGSSVYDDNIRAVAVGENGSILAYDGTEWKETEKGFYPDLNALWGRSVWEIFAAGDEGTILMYNGSKWHKAESGTYENLYGIHGLGEESGTDLFAVGGNGTVLHFDGNRWQSLDSPAAATLYGVWAAPAENIAGYRLFAAGRDGTILQYDGKDWQMQQLGSFFFYSIWGSSLSDIYAVGSSGRIFHFDGIRWHSAENGVNTTFRGIWGTAADNVYACGYGKILHYNGREWTENSAPKRMLSSIWGTSAADFFVAGWDSTIIRYRSPTIELPEKAAEGNGVLIAQGKAGIPFAQKNDLSIRLTSHDREEIRVPENIIIAAGQKSTVFDIEIRDDSIADGTQRVAVSASAPGFHLATAYIPVTDNETAALKLELPETSFEGDGNEEGILVGAAGLYLEKEGKALIAEKEICAALFSHSPSDLTVPKRICIPAGSDSVFFDLQIVDDNIFDGDCSAAISAQVEGWEEARAEIEVVDNEEPRLFLEMPEFIFENDGAIMAAISVPGILLQDFTVYAESDAPSQISVPESLLLPAGQTALFFEILPRDDADRNGTRSVQIRVFAPGWISAEAEIEIRDNEPGEIHFPGESYRVWEDAGSIEIPLIRKNSSAGEILMHYECEDGLAQQGKDYLAVSGNILFAHGEKEKSISLPLLPDSGSEGEENFFLHICMKELSGTASPDDTQCRAYDRSLEIIIRDREYLAVYEAENPQQIRSFWGSSENNVFAAGRGGKLLHFDGKEWEDKSGDTGAGFFLEDIWGFSPSDVFAAGQGGLILHYDGQEWQVMGSGTEAHLYAVRGHAGNIWAGGSNIILRYAGGQWQEFFPENGVIPDIRDMWGSTEGSLFAAGMQGQILHYDGKNWRAMHSGTAAHLYALWGSSESSVFAAGSGGILLHYDGKEWREMEKETDSSVLFLESLWGTSENNVWAGGYRGILLHYDGRIWRETDLDTGGYSITALWSVPDAGDASEIFAADESGKIFRFAFRP